MKLIHWFLRVIILTNDPLPTWSNNWLFSQTIFRFLKYLFSSGILVTLSYEFLSLQRASFHCHYSCDGFHTEKNWTEILIQLWVFACMYIHHKSLSQHLFLKGLWQHVEVSMRNIENFHSKWIHVSITYVWSIYLYLHNIVFVLLLSSPIALLYSLNDPIFYYRKIVYSGKFKDEQLIPIFGPLVSGGIQRI